MKRHYLVLAAAFVMIIGSCSGTPKEKAEQSTPEPNLAMAVSERGQGAGIYLAG